MDCILSITGEDAVFLRWFCLTIIFVVFAHIMLTFLRFYGIIKTYLLTHIQFCVYGVLI